VLWRRQQVARVPRHVICANLFAAIANGSSITLPADALRQLDVVSHEAAVPATTSDGVLYNAALALMQGGGQGFASAFTVLARCSQLQASSRQARCNSRRCTPIVASHSRRSAVPSSTGCGFASAARMFAGSALLPLAPSFTALCCALRTHSVSQGAPSCAAMRRARDCRG
jgi:hypothetical protein